MTVALEMAQIEVARLRRHAKSTADFWNLQRAMDRVADLEAAVAATAATWTAVAA